MSTLAAILVLISAGHCICGERDGLNAFPVGSVNLTGLISHHIIGGEETTIEEHPYQVVFTFKKTLFCGGFIISEDYIVTAAHCKAEPSDIVLKAGSTLRSTGTIIPIAEMIVHPEYRPPVDKNDVAVLKTAQKIVFSDTMKAIPLASEGHAMVTGSLIEISGWGSTEEGGTTDPDHLMAVKLPVVAHDLCEKAFPGYVSADQFCAGNFELGGQDACKGDSGGAAVQDGVAVGIVSFGRGCGRPGYPTVFGDIGAKSIRDFIKEKTGV